MRCEPRSRLWGVVLLASFLVVVPLSAGEDARPDLADATPEQLGQIKVYAASKHLQPGTDAPSSVTVITADEIAEHGYRTLADVLGNVRGMFVTYDRNYSSLGVRGFARPGDYNTRVLLLVDGHRLNDNVYDEAMIGTEFPIDIDLIERVEVIRGPVSSLYGSNALFAVVNIITRRGRDVRGLELSAEAASFNTYQGRITYGRELQASEFLISGTFYGSRGQNRLYFPFFSGTNNGIAAHADDDQVGSALATFSFRNITLQGVYGIRQKGIPTAPYASLFNQPGTRATDGHSYLDLRYQRSLGASWEVLARAFYDKYTYQGTYIYASLLDPSRLNPNQDFADGNWWGSELQVTKRLARKHRVTAGGEYRNNSRQDQDNFDTRPFALYMDSDRHSFVGAAYVQDEFSITKSLTLNAGLRYDYYSSISDAKLNPRAALIYRPWSRTTLKYIYGQAFRVPNIYEMYYSVIPNLPNPKLKPEKSRSNELVWEQGAGKHVWVSTSVFYNDVDDLITQEPTANDQVVFRNLKNLYSIGAEQEVRAQLRKGLEGTVSYAYQQTKDELSQQFLGDSPRQIGKLSLTQAMLRRRLFFTVDARYRSRMQWSGGQVSPFAVVNATLLGRNLGKHLDLSTSVYNLLNKRYYDPPSGANLGMPIEQDFRSFRLKLTWHPGER